MFKLINLLRGDKIVLTVNNIKEVDDRLFPLLEAYEPFIDLLKSLADEIQFHKYHMLYSRIHDESPNGLEVEVWMPCISLFCNSRRVLVLCIDEKLNFSITDGETRTPLTNPAVEIPGLYRATVERSNRLAYEDMVRARWD